MTQPAADGNYGVLTDPTTLRIQRLLPGPIERVWAYLTESDLRRQWLAAGAMQAVAGTAFELVWRNDELSDAPSQRPAGFADEHRMQSHIVEFEPPRKLVFTWQGSGKVSFELRPQGDQVLLTVIHTQLHERNDALMVGAGWHMHLDLLLARLAGARGASFWDGWSRLRQEYDRRIPA